MDRAETMSVCTAITCDYFMWFESVELLLTNKITILKYM